MPKAPIPRRYLSKANGQWRPVRLHNLASLIFAALQAAEDPEIGWADTHESIDSAMNRLSNYQLCDPRLIEALLWSANMLNEKGKFKDVKGRSFEDLTSEILNGKGKFDPVYGTIEWYTKKEE